MKILRNNATYPGQLRGLQIFAGNWINADGAATHVFTLETRAQNVVYVIAYAGTTLIAPTIANSTAHPGTKKVSWTVPISGTIYYEVICSDVYIDTGANATAAVDTTYDDAEVY